ncbi:MAG: AbrB/MazE/SpoVT family DNA-binding domain-containing protein [Lentisphaerae bacterium]|nr:AbrB/MazE/SpoVT family DNA-binding domain-containing protein [Lentisphaerota bacterium]
MNATIQINSRGTLTIPKALRKTLGLDKGGTLYAENTKGGIVLRPTVTFPIEIYTDDRVKEFDESDSELESLLRKKRKLE